MPGNASVYVLDFETFYSDEFSLRKMPTEAYILDRQFEMIGCAVDDGSSVEFLTKNEFVRWAAGVDWSRCAMIGHNLKFDAAIAAWLFGIVAGWYVDTMGIANQFIRPYTGRVSLDACCRYLGLPLKSNALKDVKGLRAHEIVTMGLWDAYATYGMGDARNTREIFKIYWPRLTRDARVKLDWTVRNYITPKLQLDRDILEANLAMVENDRKTLQQATGLEGVLFRSPHKFADKLREMGVEVESKSGKAEDIPAVAKNDPFLQGMLHGPDLELRMLAKARLAFSSSLELTRSKRLLRMHAATGGLMLAPYNYCAAHTGRPGGSDGVNLTNLASGSALRKAIKAPPGKKIVTVDASQVEARIVAELAGCKALSDIFRAGGDPYAEFMSMVLNEKITKATHPVERQCGKVCILSLQYGVGKTTLNKRLRVSNIIKSDAEAEFLVYGYRNGYPTILGTGNEGVTQLSRAVLTNQDVPWRWGMLLTPYGIRRPNGEWLLYDQLQVQMGELVYYSHRYKSWQKLYAGSFNENLAQAMANDIVGQVHVKYVDKVVLHNYDALSVVVDDDEAEAWRELLIAEFSVPPAWAPTIPLAAEGKIDQSFG
jgi:DNA polymerase